jgi:uncharacterized membrane protein
MTIAQAKRELLATRKLLTYAEQRTREALDDERVARAEFRTKQKTYSKIARRKNASRS